ncbi:hypothetical protein QR685DRAFT_594756 [Neurospora intermedia]|uniref:Uncharacterized protein n=1 Tax=Neurospora intermedia TaxID=5142 RepID=A0ABR3DJT6_NEUIN
MPHLSSHGLGLLHLYIPRVIAGREYRLNTHNPSRTMGIWSPATSFLALRLTEQEQTSFYALLELYRNREDLEHPVGLTNEEVRDAAYDTIGITDFENPKNKPPRQATARTGQLPTRRDGSAVYLVDIANFTFKQAWNTSNDNDYEHQWDELRRLKEEPNCLGMKPA